MLNLLEHYVKRIYSIKDITGRVKEHIDKPDLLTKYYEVDMDVVCYGVNERVKEIFTDEGLDELKNRGFYLA